MNSSQATPAESTAPPVAVHKLLTGQKALVTGANSGIGKAVAIALGHAGADVVVNYVADDAAADAVVEEIRKSGASAYAHKADVASEDQVAAMFARMMREFGTIDILVSNAGMQRDSAFDEMTLAQWNTVLDVNLTGQFLCAREAVREFLRRGVVPSVSRAAGKIICMSSVHQVIPWARPCQLRRLQGRHQIDDGEHGAGTRAATHPRQCHRARRDPDADQYLGLADQGAYDALMTLVPYGRIGEPEDIARAAVWLASDHSDYVVGTTLFVDGGMTLYPGFATGG